MHTQTHYSNAGKVLEVKDDIIIGLGLKNAFMGEVVLLKSKKSEKYGFILNLEKEIIKIVLLNCRSNELNFGDTIYRTWTSVQTKIGLVTLGTMVNPLGELMDNSTLHNVHLAITSSMFSSVFSESPSIIEREPVRSTLYTGINSIDCFIPIGYGQRELLIGDRGTGKTSLGISIILHQRYFNSGTNIVWRMLENVLNNQQVHSNFIACVYVAIGQKRAEVARLRQLLLNLNCYWYTCIVFTAAEDTPALQYLAPYAGCTIAEFFRDAGHKCIIVYDDLSSHAVAYRQMSLLLRRPPGREAYPGDIFYAHSRLLERAAQLNKNYGGGALASLPLIETRAGDISAYIATNVISITDGQVYLSMDAANKGIRPAVHLGLSVSRVGSAAHTLAIKSISRRLKLSYAVYTVVNGMDRLSDELDPAILMYIHRGRCIDHALKQSMYSTAHLIEQLFPLFLISKGIFDLIDISFVNLYFLVFIDNSVLLTYLFSVEFMSLLYNKKETRHVFESALRAFNIELFGNYIITYAKRVGIVMAHIIMPSFKKNKLSTLEGEIPQFYPGDLQF